MKVSIITVCYNSQITIKSTIESVLKQTYHDIEYIIIDGKSTDTTVEIISSYNDKRIFMISEPDCGIYDAINKGIKNSTGDVVGILNSDDTYIDENVIKKIVDAFEYNFSEIIFSDVVYVDRYTEKLKRYYSSKYFRPFLFHFGFMPAHPTFFTYKHNYVIYGYYSNNFKIAADFDLLLRFIKIHKLSYYYINDLLVAMKEGGVSNENLSSLIRLNKEIVESCRNNKVYTNILIVYLKYFVKWIGLIKKY